MRKNDVEKTIKTYKMLGEIDISFDESQVLNGCCFTAIIWNQLYTSLFPTEKSMGASYHLIGSTFYDKNNKYVFDEEDFISENNTMALGIDNEFSCIPNALLCTKSFSLYSYYGCALEDFECFDVAKGRFDPKYSPTEIMGSVFNTPFSLDELCRFIKNSNLEFPYNYLPYGSDEPADTFILTNPLFNHISDVTSLEVNNDFDKKVKDICLKSYREIRNSFESCDGDSLEYFDKRLSTGYVFFFQYPWDGFYSSEWWQQLQPSLLYAFKMFEDGILYLNQRYHFLSRKCIRALQKRKAVNCS